MRKSSFSKVDRTGRIWLKLLMLLLIMLPTIVTLILVAGIREEIPLLFLDPIKDSFLGYVLIPISLLLLGLNRNIARGGGAVAKIILSLLASFLIWSSLWVPLIEWQKQSMSENLAGLLRVNLWVGVPYGLYIRFQHNVQAFLLPDLKIKALLYLLRFVTAAGFLYAAYLLSWVVFGLLYGTQRVAAALLLILPFGLIVSITIGFLNSLALLFFDQKRPAKPEPQP